MSENEVILFQFLLFFYVLGLAYHTNQHFKTIDEEIAARDKAAKAFDEATQRIAEQEL